MKDHEKRELINKLRDIAVQFAHTQQLRQRIAEVVLDALAEHEKKQEPVAWRTFDGEGGYEHRNYELNEDYKDWWEERHPNHKGWVQPLYEDPTPCQTCEALARTVMMDQTSHDIPPQRPWQGLTDEEISKAYNEVLSQPMREQDKPVVFNVCRAIEAKLKEKNS